MIRRMSVTKKDQAKPASPPASCHLCLIVSYYCSFDGWGEELGSCPICFAFPLIAPPGMIVPSSAATFLLQDS
jgi:hypothetical protein